MVTACPNLGADSVSLWGKYFLAKNYGHTNASVTEWSPCLCQNGPWTAERIPFTDALPPHKCFFCPLCKVNSKDRPDFIPWFISLDTTWHVFASNVFFNKDKPLTSDDMNSWIGLWLGHTLPKAAGWAHWLSSEQPYFHVPVSQLQAQPKIIWSQVLLDKTHSKLLLAWSQ